MAMANLLNSFDNRDTMIGDVKTAAEFLVAQYGIYTAWHHAVERAQIHDEFTEKTAAIFNRQIQSYIWTKYIHGGF
jgi:hypothetical protein